MRNYFRLLAALLVIVVEAGGGLERSLAGAVIDEAGLGALAAAAKSRLPLSCCAAGPPLV